MNLCLIHVRISVAPGREVPDIAFKSSFWKTQDIYHHNYSSLTELHVNTLAGMEYTNISPMKPSKTKAEQPKDIVLDGTSEAERKEIANKLKGRRHFRDIRLETFDFNNDVIEEEENIDQNENLKSGKGKIGKTAKKYLKELNNDETSNKKFEKQKKVMQRMSSEEDSTDRKSYAEAVSIATQELLRRSSNSVSSSKDEYELSEILHKSAAVASATTSSRPSSSLEHFTPVAGDSIDGRSSVSPGMHTTKLPFFSGNPAVEITHGIIHLYKTNYMVTIGEDLPPPATNTLCMLAVPATVDTHTVLEFTAAFCDTITRLRIVRDRTPSQYMVLVTFSSNKAAFNFYSAFNNVPFSSLTQDEVCRLAFVASVEALPSLHDSGHSLHDSMGLLPVPESTELPDCVLCLERMDESVRGVLTILCNHSFHGSCLQKWEDLCCPVCRYIQTPEPRSDNKCLVCGSLEDLWICLICGNVGCGRYTTEHAQQHYLETHHNYAMALTDNRVWDYAGDYFVHRLFQNKDDGKLVEQKGSDCDVEERECKIEAIQLECMYLLTSQLDSQRKFWEEKLSRVEERAAEDREASCSQLDEATGKCQQLDHRVSLLEKEKTHLEKKNQQLATRYASSLRELESEKGLNDLLRKNQAEWREKVKNLEEHATTQQQEVQDLKEQLRDLMFYLEAQNTVNEADEETREEIQSGQIVVGASGRQRRNKKGRKK